MESTQPYISIPKSVLAEMEPVVFSGSITIVTTPEQAAEAVRALEKESLVGFDTETKPSFRKGQSHPVALMQVSTASHSYLFRLNELGMNPDVKRFLENSGITKIGLSLKDDFFVMHRSADFEPQGFVDLQPFVKKYGIADCSLQRIYAILFGQRISKGQRLSNWEAPVLTRAQQCYAAIDAWACLKIYEYLTSGSFDPASSPYKKDSEA
ncbi:MAG: 3'-5' exonuclease domain-containing protein 2 [Bacteroidales bacterium]|nr:3'-5' exonuclease domain-containing protein 2 [Bacteroidales bacterium]MBD5377794.1 3'-5' exonuclease domain-containing protein 2 [Bacteroides sp.]